MCFVSANVVCRNASVVWQNGNLTVLQQTPSSECNHRSLTRAYCDKTDEARIAYCDKTTGPSVRRECIVTKWLKLIRLAATELDHLCVYCDKTAEVSNTSVSIVCRQCITTKRQKQRLYRLTSVLRSPNGRYDVASVLWQKDQSHRTRLIVCGSHSFCSQTKQYVCCDKTADMLSVICRKCIVTKRLKLATLSLSVARLPSSAASVLRQLYSHIINVHQQGYSSVLNSIVVSQSDHSSLPTNLPKRVAADRTMGLTLLHRPTLGQILYLEMCIAR